MVVFVLLLIAAVCAGLATLSIPTGRINLLAMSLFFLVLALLVPVVEALPA